MFAVIAFKEYPIENHLTNLNYVIDVEVEVREDFDEAKKLADLVYGDPRVRKVIIVPIVYHKG